MAVRSLLAMSSPLRDRLVVPYHDFGDPDDAPALALVAGLHGNELNGVFVLSRLAGFLARVAAGEQAPLQLCGHVVVIPAVNVMGVNVRRRAWPFDGTDINRMFPGYDGGETTQRIADAVFAATRTAARRIDVHSSNADIEELPQVRLYDPSDAERVTARWFGLQAIIEHAGNTISTATLGHAWRSCGGESFVVQAGHAGDLQRRHCDRLFRALVLFCTRAGVISGQRLDDSDDEVFHFPVGHTMPIITETAGFFAPTVEVGAWVHPGDRLGYVYDAFDGELRAEIKTPIAGLVSARRRQPLLCAGDLVARIQSRTRLRGEWVDTHLFGHGQ